MDKEQMIKQLKDAFGCSRREAKYAIAYVERMKEEERECEQNVPLSWKFANKYVNEPYDEERPSIVDIWIEEGDALYCADAIWSDKMNAYVFPDGSCISQDSLNKLTKKKQEMNGVII